MRELALARGFYPVVALDMGEGNNNRGSGKAYGKGRKGSSGGRAKGKSKGKGGGKNRGKGSGGKSSQPLPGARRFVFGRRSNSDSGSTASTTAKSTTSGSTAQHGPRFKRYRLPTSGIKEVPDDANMVEDNTPTEITPVPGDFHQHEQVHFISHEVGWASMDSGATRTVCGEATWDKIVGYLNMRGMEPTINRPSRLQVWRWRHGEISVQCQDTGLCWEDLAGIDNTRPSRSHSSPSCTTRLGSLECHGQLRQEVGLRGWH